MWLHEISRFGSSATHAKKPKNSKTLDVQSHRHFILKQDFSQKLNKQLRKSFDQFSSQNVRENNRKENAGEMLWTYAVVVTEGSR